MWFVDIARSRAGTFGAAFGTMKIKKSEQYYVWKRNVLKANAYRICHECGAHAFLQLCAHVIQSNGKMLVNGYAMQ